MIMNNILIIISKKTITKNPLYLIVQINMTKPKA